MDDWRVELEVFKENYFKALHKQIEKRDKIENIKSILKSKHFIDRQESLKETILKFEELIVSEKAEWSKIRKEVLFWDGQLHKCLRS